MEMIQNAYQGFAKQNYTMLDNLKLGYGGTKEEMQRLIDKANELNAQQGIITNYQIDSYADIVDAIHVVQTEMGITGTTAKEAGTTIQGAVASMKSAWTNLLTGLADGNANIEQLVDNLVTTVVGDGTETNLGVLGNILPAVQTALNGASALVSKALPKIVEIIPTIINDNLPVLAEAAISIIQSLMDGISQNQEMLFETIFDVVTYLAESFITMLPQIVELGLNLIVSLANGIAESLPELIPTIVDVVLQIVETLIDNVDMLVDASISIIIALADGLINALPKLIEKVPVIITKLIEAYANNAPKMIEASLKIIISLAKGLITSIPELIKAIPQIVTAIVKGFMSYMTQIKDIGKNIVNGVWHGIQSMVSWFTNKVKSFFSGIVNSVKKVLGIHSPSKVFASIGGYMAEGLGEGWDDKFSDVRDEIDKSLDFNDPSMSINASVHKIGAEAAGIGGMAYGGTSFGTVIINIDGAKYSNENSLAEAISEALQNMTDRRAAVYA